MANILERVQKITAEKLSVDIGTVKQESSFTEDLNADSLDVVELDRKSTRLNSSHSRASRMPSSA